jgi:hypothetical protein
LLTIDLVDQRSEAVDVLSIESEGGYPDLLSKKIPQARHLDDVVGRQNRANQIRLRRGVNFIQVTLIFGPPRPDRSEKRGRLLDHQSSRVASDRYPANPPAYLSKAP